MAAPPFTASTTAVRSMTLSLARPRSSPRPAIWLPRRPESLVFRLKLLAELLETAVAPCHVGRDADAVDLDPSLPLKGPQVTDA